MAGQASRVSRVVMTGPLAPFAGVYELELRRRRYTPLTVVNQLRQVARLSQWLETNGLAVAELTGDRVEEFLAFQRASGRYRAQVGASGAAVPAGGAAGVGGGGGRGAGAGGFTRGGGAGVVRALPAGRARLGDRHGPWVCEPRTPVSGRIALWRRACRRDSRGRDRGGAARVRRGVGERDPVLRGGAAVVSALLLHRGTGRGGPVTGGAAGDGSAPLVAAEGDHQAGRQRVACLL